MTRSRSGRCSPRLASAHDRRPRCSRTQPVLTFSKTCGCASQSITSPHRAPQLDQLRVEADGQLADLALLRCTAVRATAPSRAHAFENRGARRGWAPTYSVPHGGLRSGVAPGGENCSDRSFPAGTVAHGRAGRPRGRGNGLKMPARAHRRPARSRQMPPGSRRRVTGRSAPPPRAAEQAPDVIWAPPDLIWASPDVIWTPTDAIKPAPATRRGHAATHRDLSGAENPRRISSDRLRISSDGLRISSRARRISPRPLPTLPERDHPMDAGCT